MPSSIAFIFCQCFHSSAALYSEIEEAGTYRVPVGVGTNVNQFLELLLGNGGVVA